MTPKFKPVDVKDAREVALEIVDSAWWSDLKPSAQAELIAAAIEARDAEHAKLEEFMSRQSQTSDRERIKNLEQQLEQATRAIANLRNREADRASRVPSEVIEVLKKIMEASGTSQLQWHLAHEYLCRLGAVE